MDSKDVLRYALSFAAVAAIPVALLATGVPAGDLPSVMLGIGAFYVGMALALIVGAVVLFVVVVVALLLIIAPFAAFAAITSWAGGRS